jgi:small subunit ribosomal protein S9
MAETPENEAIEIATDAQVPAEAEPVEPEQEAPAGETESPAEEQQAVQEEQPAAQEEQPAAEPPAAQEEPAQEEQAAQEEPPAAAEADVAPPPASAEEQGPPKPADLSADARYSATGKRKSSVARVILKAGKGGFELNGRPLDNYFPRRTLQEVVRQPLKATGYLDLVDVRARIHGGGISSQADAVRHGIAKALIEADPQLRGELKRRQLLTRDPRVKERRKAGLKKARKRPQFSKR